MVSEGGVGFPDDADLTTVRGILDLLNPVVAVDFGVVGSFLDGTFLVFSKRVVGLVSVGAGDTVAVTVGFTVASLFICLDRP